MSIIYPHWCRWRREATSLQRPPGYNASITRWDLGCTNGKPPLSTNKTQYITLASWSQQHNGTWKTKTTRNCIIHKGSQWLKSNLYILDHATIWRAHNTTHVLPRIFPRNTNAKPCKGAITIAQTPWQVEKSALSKRLPRWVFTTLTTHVLPRNMITSQEPTNPANGPRPIFEWTQ